MLKSLGYIMLFLILGEALRHLFHLPVAANILGMIFIFLALRTRVISLGSVKPVADKLLDYILFREEYDEIKSNLIPFFAAVTIGGVSSIFIVLLSLIWLESPGFIVRSLAAKSVTTPIAIETTKLVSGIPAITAAVVIAVGIFGNVFGVPILRAFGIKSEMSIGTALGTASHGIGTARALDIGRSAAAYRGIAICVNGVVTAILVPLILDGFNFL